MKNIKFLSLMLVCLALSANAIASNESTTTEPKKEIETVEQFVEKNYSNFKEESLLLWNSLGRFEKWLASDGVFPIISEDFVIARAHLALTAEKATMRYLANNPRLPHDFNINKKIREALAKQLTPDPYKQRKLADKMIRTTFDVECAEDDILYADIEDIEEIRLRRNAELEKLINARLEKLKKSSKK